MTADAFDETMVAVRDYPSEPDARHVASLLVENGVGATIEPIPAAELSDDGPSAGYRVLVLPHQLVRAEETLGLREPSLQELADPDEPMKLEQQKAPWKLFAVIWVVAMVTVPLAAFVLTYFIMSR